MNSLGFPLLSQYLRQKRRQQALLVPGVGEETTMIFRFTEDIKQALDSRKNYQLQGEMGNFAQTFHLDQDSNRVLFSRKTLLLPKKVNPIEFRRVYEQLRKVQNHHLGRLVLEAKQDQTVSKSEP